MNNEQRYNLGKWLRSRTGLVFMALLAIAGFFLVTKHTAHFLGVLPYLLLFLCPLLHLFMHGGHEGHQHNTSIEHVKSREQNSHGGI